MLSANLVGLAKLSLAVRCLGAVVFVAGFIPGVSLFPRGPYRLLGYSIPIAIAIGASDVIGLPAIKAISAYLSVAAPIALAITFALGDFKGRQ